MRVAEVPIGACLVDSLPFSQGGSAQQAKNLKADGVHGVYGYLGVINKQRMQYILDAGLGFMPVTLAAHYDGHAAAAQALALGVLPDVTCVLDIEGLVAFHTEIGKITAATNQWCDDVASGAHLMPAGYFGSPQPFTSDEMWNLKFKRYWRGQGSIRDRLNALAEPTKCGWCCTQAYPSTLRGGVFVDVDMVGQDYLKRVPNWMIA